MDWFATNSAAIQAIASIVGVVIAVVLVGVTYWYVRLTRDISKASAEQVRLMAEAAQASKRQALFSLMQLAFRMRISLEPVTLTRAGIMSFSQPTEDDVADLEVLARQSDNHDILKSARIAVIALRNVLKIVSRAQESDRPGYAWTPTPEVEKWWSDSLGPTLRSLHEIENECAAILKPEAGQKKKTAAV